MSKIVIKELINIKHDSINGFANSIYNNFIYISDNEDLMHSKDEIKRLLASKNTICYVMYDNNNIIAYIVGEKKHLDDGRFTYYIDYIYVSKKYRGRKLGTKLIDIAINKCKNLGIKFIMLTCDTHDDKVMSFYIKIGFMPDPVLRNFKRHEVLTLYL